MADMVELTKQTTPRRLPSWLKVKAPGSAKYLELKQLLKERSLNTVCEEAHCPNIGECWTMGTATFMILGDTCTRACSYCAVNTGKPQEPDLFEPSRLAQTVERMKLEYAVITSVDRDDLEDGGASFFASCIKLINNRVPDCKVEVLIPDFNGDQDALKTVMNSNPSTLNHNIETVRRIFPKVRPKGDYDMSLRLLKNAKTLKPNIPTKSGLMVGLGETYSEITQTMSDLRSSDCDLLTVGQYLRPSQKHWPVVKWYTETDFMKIKEEGLSLGFKHVAAGPLVRSSYHASEQHKAAT
ncbi:MAG: lipoic acid synthetase [Chloroflexi bacterium]|jgi:lipoic acid synthetase|nr:MAG: lipoic acid synthetase [Chloroflexota bacterium]